MNYKSDITYNPKVLENIIYLIFVALIWVSIKILYITIGKQLPIILEIIMIIIISFYNYHLIKEAIKLHKLNKMYCIIKENNIEYIK